MGRAPGPEDFVDQEPPTVTADPAPDHEVLAAPGVIALDADARDPFDISLKSVGARIFLGVFITSSPFTWVPHANRTKLPVAGWLF